MKKFAKVLGLILMLALLTGAVSAAAEDAKVYTIGIAQFAEHPSLDNCRMGFMQGMTEAGFIEGESVKYIYLNAQTDGGMTQQIASQMANDCDLVCAIATPMAQAALGACMDKSVPVVYSAVSDPIGSMLANADGLSDYAITGTSDLLPVEAQLKLIRAFLPEAKKIGILYTTSETNSESQIKLYQELAPNYGFEIVTSGVAVGSDIPMALDALLPQIDCITNLTDNTVVSYLPVVLEKSTAMSKPVFGSEIEQVVNGCVAAEGVEYIELGRKTGQLAARVLNGEAAGSIPFVKCDDSGMSYNPTVAAALGITIPESEAARGTDVSTLAK